MVIMMFTQAFRYAYEPFVFAKNKDATAKLPAAMAMKYVISLCWFSWVGCTWISSRLIAPNMGGLGILPIICFPPFQGIFLTFQSGINSQIRTTMVLGFLLNGSILLGIYCTKYSYWASVWSAFADFSRARFCPFFDKIYANQYDLKKSDSYSLALVIFGISLFIKTPSGAINIVWKPYLIIYMAVVVKDLPLKELHLLQEKSLKEVYLCQELLLKNRRNRCSCRSAVGLGNICVSEWTAGGGGILSHLQPFSLGFLWCSASLW